MRRGRHGAPGPAAATATIAAAALLAMAGGLAGCGGGAEDEAPPAPEDVAGTGDPGDAAGADEPRPLTAEQREAAVRARGLMGRYDYDAAVALLEELAEARPDRLDVRTNLAIAILNRQLDGDEAIALELLRGVLAEDADHVRALYVAGLLELRAGEVESAAGRLGRVAELDPDDPYAAYFHGQAIEPFDAERALAEYERALAADPYQRSAVYRAAVVARRLGRIEEATERLELFQRLEDNPQARSAEFVYTRMGTKAEVTAPGPADGPREPVPAPEGPLFADAVAIAYGLPAFAAGVPPVAADLDGDGDVDLYLPRAVPAPGGEVGGPGARGLVLLREGGSWMPGDPESPLAAVTDVNAALLEDLDDDGDVDAYLLRTGPNVLLRRDAEAPGGWVDATEASGTAGGPFRSVDGLMVDADHDGDLDLLVANADGPDELFSHDVDGLFRSLAVESGLAESGAGSRRILVEDLDADRDLDIVVLRDEGTLIRINDRLWDWRDPDPADAALAALAEARLLAAVTADADADGRPELYGAGRDGTVSRWTADDGWSRPPIADRPARLARPRLAILDVDGDGGQELLVADGDGRPRVLPLPGDDAPAVSPPSPWAPAAWAVVPASEPGRGPAVVAIGDDGTARLHDAGPGRWPFLAVDLRGRVDTANSLRSNAAGVGTRYAARAGDAWTAGRFLRPHSGPGQGRVPRFVGLGDRGRLDFIELEWPDGVFQSEVHAAADPGGEPVDLSAGRIEIVETQRQLSSCPVIFAWDGERWSFVSDVLGVGGLGYLLEPGLYAPPRPRERFLMPAGLPAAADGRLSIRIHQPKEEICYLDHAAFDAWDLPPGWDVVPDERMDTAPPRATGEPRFFRLADERRPVRATDAAGRDVLASLLELDEVAAPTPAPDPRFLGRLTAEHVVTLEFDRPVDGRGPAGRGVPTLVADGWVEYPYSQTRFAGWQAGVSWDPVTVEARRTDGTWIVVADEAGYPAGMPRRMSLPLADLPAGCTALRLRTTIEVHWDRLSVVPTVAAEAVEPAPVHRRLEPMAATLRRTGFPHRTTGPHRRPRFDYHDRAPFNDMRAIRGFYTAEGDVLELVSAIDDATAVIGPGEEVRVEVAAPPAPPAGWSRRLVLDVAGWCKDMDLFTAGGDTVEPMPAREGRPSARAVELDERTRTRFRSGR